MKVTEKQHEKLRDNFCTEKDVNSVCDNNSINWKDDYVFWLEKQVILNELKK